MTDIQKISKAKYIVGMILCRGIISKPEYDFIMAVDINLDHDSEIKKMIGNIRHDATIPSSETIPVKTEPQIWIDKVRSLYDNHADSI